jgi:hypothetical protein
MRINLGITGPKANLWVNATTLIDALARAIKILDLVVSKEIYPEILPDSLDKAFLLECCKHSNPAPWFVSKKIKQPAYPAHKANKFWNEKCW